MARHVVSFPEGPWPRRIVVGVEGSSRSADALALGGMLAAGTGASLIAAAVYGTSHAFGDLGTEDAGAEVLEHVRRSVPEASVDGVRLVRAASPVEGLSGVAREEAADIVVVGPSHQSGFGRVRPGAVGSLLMTAAPCAIAVAPRGFAQQEDAGIRVTGVGYDASPGSARALAAAESLAVAAGGAMRIFSVVADRSPDDPRAQEMFSALADAAREVAPEARALPVPLKGYATASLIDHSNEVDMLVLGTRGHGRASRAVLGSVAETLMLQAACPVMVVPLSDHGERSDVAADLTPVQHHLAAPRV